MTAVDTSVVVASLLDWHEHHERAVAAVGAATEPLIVPLHVVVEAYSVMTRLPPAQRVAPGAAERVLRESWSDVVVADLPPDRLWQWLAELASSGVIGGLVYDARILESARLAGARRLLTFNRRHFERLAPDDVEIVVP